MKGRNDLEDLILEGDNIKISIKWIVLKRVGCIHATHVKDKPSVLVNMVMNTPDTLQIMNLVQGWATISLSRMSVPHGVAEGEKQNMIFIFL
jgi:hypothetical protein